MEAFDYISRQTQKHLVTLLDVMIVVAIWLSVQLFIVANIGTEMVLAFVNAVAILLLRHWLMRILSIHNNISWLNRLLKRIIGTATGIIISITVLPLLCLIAFPLIKTKSRGPIMHRIFLLRKGKIVGKGFTFRHTGSLMDDPLLQKIAVFSNLITGSISLWNFRYTEIVYPEYENISENIQNKGENDISYDESEDKNKREEDGTTIKPDENIEATETSKSKNNEYIQQTFWS